VDLPRECRRATANCHSIRIMRLEVLGGSIGSLRIEDAYMYCRIAPDQRHDAYSAGDELLSVKSTRSADAIKTQDAKPL
jgi:hypothetical protein